MNRKLTFVLVVMAIIPIGLLSWMGFAGIQSEKERREQQIQYLGNQKLEIVRNRIERVFIELEDELGQVLNNTGTNIDEIRAIQRNHDLIKQIFITHKDGLIYPSAKILLSRREEAFLARIKETDISFNFLQKSETEESGGTFLEGWHTWFMGNGLNFIYWNKKETTDRGVVIEGIELNRSALLSKIINSLPETNEDNSSIRISLFDVSGNILYQWGSWSPTEKTVTDSELTLNYPLSSWHLEYYIDPGAVNRGGNRLLLTVSLLTMLLVIIALAIYLYRESTREIREAAQKVSFVNQVSHELKTPLTNIRMYAELLERKFAKEDRKTKKHLNIIISESSRLGRLINNVLSFAKDQKNGVNFNPVPAVPDEIITRLLDSFSYSLKTKGIKLQPNLNASETVMLDTDILEQILSNLISNVEKYAASGKWIKVETELVDDMTVLTVSDRGPGIPGYLEKKIFESFFRVSNKLTDGVSGTGIGLSLVRTLAEIHGGSVVLLSDDSTKGAIFQVRLRSRVAGRQQVGLVGSKLPARPCDLGCSPMSRTGRAKR